MVMKFFPHVQNCGPSIKIQKNRKNNFGNIFKIFFKNRRFTAAFRRFSKKIFQQFSENILKMFPKLFFRFFGIFLLAPQFCTSDKIFITIVENEAFMTLRQLIIHPGEIFPYMKMNIPVNQITVP